MYMSRCVSEFFLTAANGGYDFKSVAILKELRCEQAARNDFAVSLKRNAFTG